MSETGRRSRAEEALHVLHLQEARWQAILDTARDAIVSIDAAGRVTLFNRTAELVFGYTAAEVLGRNVAMLMPAPYQEEHDGYLARYAATREPHAIGRIREVWGKRKSGEVIPLELSVGEAQVADEVMYTAVLRDVTERRSTEQALRRMSKVFMEGADPIVITDLDGLVTDLNPAAEGAYGWSRAELIGRPLGTIVPPEQHPVLEARLAQCRRNDPPRACEGLRCDRGGHVTPVLVTFSLLAGEDGTPEGIATIARDLSERRRAEAERMALVRRAQQRERLADVGAVTAKVVHDLGNPVAGISMAAQRVLRSIERDPERPVSSVREPAEHVIRAARRLEVLINDFKDFAREQRLDLADVDVAALLREVTHLWEPEAAARKIALALEAPPNVTIRADADKLRRVLDNLLKNALESVEGEGAVWVRAVRPAAAAIRILVEDTGLGIPAGMNVFDLFETTKAHGTGLGLAVCRQIVEAHGGGIGFAARVPHGTVFHVELPIGGPV